MKHVIPIAKPVIGEEEIAAVTAVLQSGIIAQDSRVREFEEQFAALTGTNYAIAVNSGTAALHVALLARGIGRGDEVITSPFTFISTASAILFTGATPVFADISLDSFNITPASIEEKITPQTRAVIPVHLYGQPCDMKGIMEIARKHNLIIIEDACQAHGAEYNGRKVGSFGTGCFSFYPTKNMTTGEGGMITTNDEDITQRARMIRNHGQKQRYYHDMLGYNYRMTDIAAAIGLCQLGKLEGFTRRRKENAAYLAHELNKILGLITPGIQPGATHVFHQYTIRVTPAFGMSRDELRKSLAEKGIMTEIYYPLPIHQQPVYRELGYNDSLPNAEQAAKEVLSLPVHPSLAQEDLEEIVEGIKNA